MSNTINDRQSKPAKIEPRLLTAKQAAVYLNISPRTIYNGIGRKAVKRFPVPVKRVGRSIRFDIRDLEAYVESL